MNIPLARPSITALEKKYVDQVLASGQLSRGPMLARFEQAFARLQHSPHALGTASGTAALIIALQALGIAPGDEVITVSFTVPATLNAILAVGARPRLLDINPDNLGLSTEALRAQLHAGTRAVVLVHAFGRSADVRGIAGLCAEYGVPLIEDACEVAGNAFAGRMLGTWGCIGVFGFYANKQITTAEGGMAITADEDLHRRMQRLRNHGRRMDGRWCDQDSGGWNFRLSELHAALGVAQLERHTEIAEKRRALAQLYTERLQRLPVTCPRFSREEPDSCWFVYVIQTPQRDAVAASLARQGIQCGKYFAPLHWQPHWKQNHPALELPVTERVASQTLALPFFTDMREADLCRVTDALAHALAELT